MRRLLPASYWKMYLIQLRLPPSTFHLITPLITVLCQQLFALLCILTLHPLHIPYLLTAVAICTRDSHPAYTANYQRRPYSIHSLTPLRWLHNHRNSHDVTHSVRLSAIEIKHHLAISRAKDNVVDIIR